jgi:hypothetical protein
VDPGLHRLSGPLRQQAAGGQPAHALVWVLHRDMSHIQRVAPA